MLRSRAHYTTDRPGCVTATTVTGDTWSVGPIVSPYLRIVEVGTDGSGRVKVKTQGKHGLQTGASVNACLGGYHGTTWRAHPGNVTDTEVERIDDYWLSLTGTVAAVNSAFWHGLLWRTGDNTTGYAATLNELSLQVEEAGGGFIEFPGGFIGLETQLWFRSNVFFLGKGKDVTNFVSIDGNETHPLREYGMRNHGGQGFTVWGMRQRKNVFGARHAIRAGADGLETFNFRIIDVGVKGSAGYGIAYQDDAKYTRCVLDVEVDESDADNFDIKNRMNSNSGNNINIRGRNCGLLWVGVDGPEYNFNADPFTTVSGSSIVTVAWTAEVAPNVDAQAYYGIHSRVTYPNAGTLNGIDMGGTFTIVGRVVGGYSVETEQTATSSGTGGGTGLIEQPALVAQGDAVIDLRGEDWQGGEIRYEGALFMRSGPRFRGGTTYPTNPQGLGAGLSTMTTVITKNTSEFKTNALGVSVEAWQCNVPSVIAHNCQEGVFFGTTSHDNTVGLAQAFECAAGAVFRGNRNKINAIAAEDTTTAAAVYLGSDHSIGSVKGTGLTIGVHVYPDVTNTTVCDWQGVSADIKVIDAGTASIFIPSLPYHPEVYLWAHAVIMAGGATNDTELEWRSDFIYAIGDIWDRAYDFQLWGPSTDPIASRISLKFRALCTGTSGATHVPLQGYQGNGVDGALDTQINMKDIMDNDSSGTLCAFVLDDVAGGAKTIMGAAGGPSASRLQLRTAGDRIYGQIQSQLGTFAETVTSTKGFTLLQRDVTDQMSAYKPGTAIADITVTNLNNDAPNNNLWVLGHNSGSGLTQPTDNLVFATGLLRPLTTLQMATLADAMEALATATGAWP